MFCTGLGSAGAKCIYILIVFSSSGCTDRLPGPMVKPPITHKSSVQQPP